MSSLAKKLKNLFKQGLSPTFYDSLEDTLIEADLGPTLAYGLREGLEKLKPKNEAEALTFIKNQIAPYIAEGTINFTKKPVFLLFLGVNGVGKTTTIAKLARYAMDNNLAQSITVAAADTFRAAASEQIALHGAKQGFKVVKSNQGGDPGAIVHDAITSALSKNDELIIADTAGRMHNKNDLVNELKKINKIILSRIPAENYYRILVIDATTGQNGLRQAEVFNEALGLSGIVLTKYDGTAKGGNIITIGKALGLPVFFIGQGEKITDLKPFDKTTFLDDLFS